MERTTDERRRPLAAVILAAGRGTRMPSDRPKVVHAVAGKPMVRWVVEAVRTAGAERIVLVVGFAAEQVRAIFAGERDVEFADQPRQLGTGHAVRCAEPALRGFVGDVLVLAGDGPLIRPATIEALRRRHERTGAAVTLATSVVDDPTGYGRVLRDGDGRFEAIVEHRNATTEQRAVREIYPSYACFDARRLFELLSVLAPNETTGEYYITDLPAILRSQGETVELVDAVPPEDVLSINTFEQLELVDSILTERMEGVRP